MLRYKGKEGDILKQKSHRSHNLSNTKLSFFAFFTLTASMTMSIYAYPTFASAKAHLIFYLILCGLLWFLPVSLCAAEMSTVKKWENGSIYTWVSKTLGHRFGFAAIFFQWFKVTVGFISMLYFALGALSFVFDIDFIMQNPLLKFLVVSLIFILLTLSQLKGTKMTTLISKIGFISGVLIPITILFVLQIIYLIQGNPMNIVIDSKHIFPSLASFKTMVIFASFILAYTGVEASASYINALDKPNRNYPLVMITLAIIAIILNTVGGLSVAIAVDSSKLSLDSGLFQAFSVYINTLLPNHTYLIKIIALFVAFGILAEISSWIVGPTKGMYFAATQGILAQTFTKTNKHNVTTNLLYLQCVVVIIWAFILTVGGTRSNVSFLSALQLTVVIYIAAYILFFIAYFKLNLKMDYLNRTYQVPGPKPIKLLIASSGLVLSIFGLIMSFFPPENLSSSDQKIYIMILASSFIITVVLPFIIYYIASQKRTIIEKREHLIRYEDINKLTRLSARGSHDINKIKE